MHKTVNKLPPPILDSARVVAFAVNDSEVEYTDKIDLHICPKDGQSHRLGEVPYLAISRPYNPYNSEDQLLLMFCDSSWQVEAALPYTTIEEAKIKAERGYKGISSKWMLSPYSEEQIDDFLRDEYEVDPKSEWWTTICSFCGRKDSELEAVVFGKYANICKSCTLRFAEAFNKSA